MKNDPQMTPGTVTWSPDYKSTKAAMGLQQGTALVVKRLQDENERLRAAFEQAASIVFNGVEEEDYPGSIDRRPETLKNAILALVK
jgi:hypothetical protein